MDQKGFWTHSETYKGNPRLCVHIEQNMGWAYTFGRELGVLLQAEKETVIMAERGVNPVQHPTPRPLPLVP